jgi:phosphoglucosamine mutase
MQEKDYSLGGEQSGHIILKKYATTGDGILTAIMITEEVCASKSALSKLHEQLRLYPQYTENIRVKNKDAVFSDQKITAAVERVNSLIDGKGRVLLRKSGTEPVVRVMVETESEEKCREYAGFIAKEITSSGL